MVLQAESIQKFLDPCTHWVIINDIPKILNNTKNFWYDTLPQFYANHNLKILIPEWDRPEYCTWKRQQMLKFWIFKFIKDDYLILDSKNFFIKECSVDEWKDQTGCGILQDYKAEGKWMETSEFYARQFGNEVITQGHSIHTPFVFKKQVLEKIEDIDVFCKEWIDSQLENNIMPSEFLYYTYLDKENLKNFKNLYHHYTVWPGAQNTWEQILETIQQDNYKVFGMHFKVLDAYTEEQRNNYKKLLLDLGFQKGVALLD